MLRFLALLLALTTAAGLGAVCARLLLPNPGPCSLDWAVASGWIQAVFILAGVLVAWHQLATFNKNERVKNTLQVYGQFAQVVVEVAGGDSLTVMVAGVTIASAAMQTEEIALLLQKDREDMTAEEFGYIRKMRSAVVVVHNYFDTVALMLERKLIDRDLYLSAMGNVVIRCYENLCKVLAVDSSVIKSSPLFATLCVQAQDYEKLHPERFAHIR